MLHSSKVIANEDGDWGLRFGIWSGKLTAIERFCGLVQRLGPEGISRGENDLSARLARCFEQVGLHTVIDTSTGQDSRRRPDIVGYLDEGSSDLGGFGEIVVEAKKPSEVPGNLLDAILSEPLWGDKFLPYTKAHLPSIRYFCLTTFERHIYIEITSELRELLNEVLPDRSRIEPIVRANCRSFDLVNRSDDWIGWINASLSPGCLEPPIFSEAIDLLPVDSAERLEAFADQLATLVAGEVGTPESNFALINSVRIEAASLSELPSDIAASLSIYVLAQHPGMDAEAARAYLADHLESELSNFVSASVQSLIGRLFAFKMIEDCFCIGVQPPLIAPDRYIFHHNRYDGATAREIVARLFEAVRTLEAASSPAIRNLSRTGRFYDWIEDRVEPKAFERVFRAFASHSFSSLSGDLLGRFFEHYAQRVDKRRRRRLGQYYTPPAIVQFIWKEALEIAANRGSLDDVRMLDPGVGSAAFLTEGARKMSDAGVPRFWERLVGFDIDPQVIGVAYVNLFLAVLSRLERTDAELVEKLHLYPTDALEPTSAAPLNAYLPLLTAEPLRQYLAGQIELSVGVKAANAYNLVIGNPPYRNNSTRTLQQVAETFPRLLQTSRANARLRERNIRDDYAWFFAAADYYIHREGLIGFVVSSSFCSADSYRFFRLDLLRHYRVRRLVHLGTGIFEDVGPRTSFVIVILEKRENPIDAADIESHEFYDLRDIEEPEERVGLLTLACAGDWSAWPRPETVSPVDAHNYRLHPIDPIVPAVKAAGLPLFASDDEPAIFLKKWPGLITALDSLWRSPNRDDLVRRMERFFATAHDRSSGAAARVDSFLGDEGLEGIDAERVRVFLQQVRDANLQFDAGKIKRIISGTSPNTDCWYPAPDISSWVYYEPNLRVPRNINGGRPVGYGTMTQWREPESHAISPKLIFTTGSSSRNGLKAYVVEDEWYVKLHGGTRQQFHYTGCENPLRGAQLDGLPNNLSPLAAEFFATMRAQGWGEVDFLLYLAAFYNSPISNEFLDGGGGKAMHIPFAEPDLALQISSKSHEVQRLAYAGNVFAQTDVISARDAALDLSSIADQGLVLLEETAGGRFRASQQYRTHESSLEDIGYARAALEHELGELVCLAIGLEN